MTAPALPGPVALVDHADGAARIETYTVTYDREGAPARGIVVGRLLDGGARFLANTPDDRALLESLVTRAGVGLRGAVRCVEGANRFVPA